MKNRPPDQIDKVQIAIFKIANLSLFNGFRRLWPGQNAVLCSWHQRVVLCLAALFVGAANAATTYTLPDGTLPSGCTNASSTSVTCTGNITLASNDVVKVSNANLTWTVNGTLKFSSGNTINTSSTVSGFAINAKDVGAPNALQLFGNLTATNDMAIKSNANSITGNLVAGGRIDLGGSLTGTLQAGGVVTTQYATQVTGNISAGTSFTSGGGSTYGGNVTAGGDITSGSGDKFSGDVTSTSGAIKFSSSGNTVVGNVSARNAVLLQSGTKVAGSVTSSNDAVTLEPSGTTVGNGISAKKDVTLGSGCKVTGSVTSTNGNVDLKSSDASVSSCVTLDSNKKLNLGWNASVGGVCCLSGGAGGTCSATGCVVNNSGNAAPGACSAPVPAPLADYRFDEVAWSGSTGEVKDSSAGKVDGKAFGGATTALGKVCNAGTFNGFDKYVSVAGLSNLLSGTATLSFWINTTQTGNNSPWRAPGVSGVEQRGGVDDVFWGWINASGRIAVNKGNTLGAQSTTSVNTGTWRHIVLTRDQSTGETKAYVDGLLNNTRKSDKGVVTRSFSSIGRIENSYLSSAAPFDLDEVKVFSAVLSDAQVSAIYANENAGKNWDGAARVCPISGPHHLEIQSSGSGLTCAASTLTIRACADAACATLYTGGVSGTLSASGTPTVNWDGTTGGATGAGFVIPSGSSSVTKNVQVATAGSVVFGIGAPTPAPTSTTTCNFGSPSCTFTAQTAGFIFSNTATGNAYAFPAQVSGIASAGLFLRALQTSTSNPAVCTPAIIGQTTPVNLGYACNNPSTCQPGSLATVNATAIAPAGTAVNLTFDANGSAPVTLRYDDVGQITYNASKTVTPFGGSTPVTLTGSSNAVVVAPHHFDFSNVTAGPIKAGTNFSATVTAYNGLATPTATPNFGKEAPPEQVTIDRVRYKPTGAGTSDGLFSGSLGAFNLGTATANNLNWSEVGIIDLSATLASGSYLASGLTATGTTGATGAIGSDGSVVRFIPDHFETVVALTAGVPMPCPVGLICPAQYNGFVYSGQGVPLTITAKNGLSTPTTTVNYNYSATASESFSKAVTLNAVAAVGGSAIGTTAPGGLASAVAVPASSFSAGTTTTPVFPVFTFAAIPTVPTDAYWRAFDSDSVSSLRSTPSSSIEGGVKVVSGRLNIVNAYGSELLTLPMNVKAQYYNGSSWATSTTDSLSTPGGTVSAAAVTGATLCTGLGFAATPAAVASGIGSFTLTKPSNGRCSADITLTAPSYLPSVSARATFGIYKSPLIYRRENY